MLRLILAVVVLGFMLGSPARAAEWELVWSDEFSTPGYPDAHSWTPEHGGHGWGNDELQYYSGRLENARVEDGHLVIEARKEERGMNQYTSARLITKGKRDFTYGRFEVRAKLPYGRGTWPAIWMLATGLERSPIDWPDNGEIDIMEHVGFNPGVVHGSAHTFTYNWLHRNAPTGSIVVPDFSTAFHNYVVEWDPDELRVFVDNTKYMTFRNPQLTWREWPFDQKFHLILNIAVGGFWGGAEGIDDTIFPQKMLVDYVRVYQRPSLRGDR